MSDNTPSLQLPYILPAQAQKHITHNEALDQLDQLVQLVVTAYDATTPPAEPQEGTAYTIGSNATNEWAGLEGKIASWQNGGWVFTAPKSGWRASTPAGDFRIFDGAAWKDARCFTGLHNLPALGVGATADDSNKLVVSSDATLLTHAGAGHQVKINKSGEANTASVLFQSNWTGHAEMGLSGSNNFNIKVSADSGNWINAISIARDDGTVTMASMMTLTPSDEPATPLAGTVYFDSATAKLRCYDGSIWNDLY